MAGFSLYVRKRKKGKPIYYAQFRTTTGSWSTAKSTGCTTRRAAEQFCEAYLRKKAYFLPGTTVTFLEFSKNFFSWEGDWATDKRMNGKRISRRHCIERNEILRNHVLLVFGPYNLTDIDRAQIKRFKLELYRNSYSGSLINKCLYILRAILTAAEERELIKAVPTIERAAENPRPKGILSIDEVNRLFSAPWGDFRGYVGNLLAASTGLRIGELQGLVIEDLHLDDGYIIVRRSWDRCTGMLN